MAKPSPASVAAQARAKKAEEQKNKPKYVLRPHLTQKPLQGNSTLVDLKKKLKGG